MAEPELDLGRLRAIAQAAHDLSPSTPGRGGWHWSGLVNKHGYKAVRLSNWRSGLGRCTVMDFRRMGMQGAQPGFPDENLAMHPSTDFVQFEVGNPGIVGLANADSSVYRGDVCGLAHPVAEHIATFDPPTILALLDLLAAHTTEETE